MCCLEVGACALCVGRCLSPIVRCALCLSCVMCYALLDVRLVPRVVCWLVFVVSCLLIDGCRLSCVVSSVLFVGLCCCLALVV